MIPSADSATITSSSSSIYEDDYTSFVDNSSAGSATIKNSGTGSITYLFENSTADQAKIINQGTVEISSHNDGIAIGEVREALNKPPAL